MNNIRFKLNKAKPMPKRLGAKESSNLIQEIYVLNQGLKTSNNLALETNNNVKKLIKSIAEIKYNVSLIKSHLGAQPKPQ
jgi:hypothetical protein